MHIRDIYAANLARQRPTISFELFPPKGADGVETLLGRTLPALKQLAPDFVSVTYGAGGSTRDLSLDLVDRAQRELGLVAMLHLTCVGASVRDLRALLEQARARGIENILALRGDPPAGETEWRPAPDGLLYARQLVELVRSYGNFSIGVAGFPEGHIASRGDRQRDWAYLKEKIDAGADFVITQLFFENADYFAFVEHMRDRLGVRVPIVPGVLPILSASQIKRFTALCGSRLPDALLAALEARADDDQAVTEYGIEYATRQCRELLERGAPGIHFYTLNRTRSTAAILANLGLTASVAPGDGR